MRIGTKGDYGVRALIDLAMYGGDGPVQRAEIARRQHVPEAYLDHLLAQLRRAGFIRSMRGPSGGHELARPAEEVNLQRLSRTFTLRTSEGFAENFGPDLIARVREQAPGVRLCFVQKPDKDSTSLRDGIVDLETGVVGKATAPELRVQALFRDRFIGVVGMGHPLCQGEITPARYAAGGHILVSRRGVDRGPIDEALTPLGLERGICVTVAGFSTALALARVSDLIASVPERHTGNLRAGLHSFPLPVSAPEITVALFWHPRLNADPAHRWLRGQVRDVCTAIC